MAFDVSYFGLTQDTLPPGWREGRLDSIASFNPEQIGRDYPHQSIQYLDISSVNTGYSGEPVRMTIEDAPSRAQRLVTAGDTILSTVRPGNRAYAFLKTPPGDLVVSTGFAVLRARDCDPRFLYYMVTSKPLIDYLASIAEEKSAYPSVRPEDIAECRIPIPPLPVQREIASILGAFDDKIELNRRMNETLEAMARALFKCWFVDFEPVRMKAKGIDPSLPPAKGGLGLDPEIAALFPDSFVDSELGEIPKGWTVARLEEVAENPRRGVHPDQIEPDTPYIALEHMPRRCIALSDWGAAEGLESSKFEFRSGEILFGKLRPYFRKVGVAPVDGVCSTDIVVVVPKSEQWFGFVLGHVASAEFVNYVSAGSTGTKMPRTKWADMGRYEVALPPKPLATAFTRQIRQVVEGIIAAIHESNTLAAIRDALLPKLISGDIVAGRAR